MALVHWPGCTNAPCTCLEQREVVLRTTFEAGWDANSAQQTESGPSSNVEESYKHWRWPEGCDRCGEREQLAKIKGCLYCLRCKYKADCYGF